MSQLLPLLLGLVAALLAWSWASRSTASSNEMSVVVVLAALAAAFNVIVPLPNLELTTTVVVCAAIALGIRPAAATGMLSVIATGVVGGLGMWTAWQMLGYAAIAAMIGLGARGDVASYAHRTSARLWLAALVAISVTGYDIVVTLMTVLGTNAAVASHPLQLLLVGLPYTVLHVVGSVTLTLAAGPALLQSLTRAQLRLGGGQRTRNNRVLL